MKLRRGAAYWVLVIAAGLWVGLTFLAPWARSQGFAWSGWIYAFFAPICHQLPERSFACWGSPLAVCHRCLGLYGGFWAGLLLLPHLHRLRRALLDQPRWILAIAAPMLIDAVALYQVNLPASRLATGFLAAFPLGLLVWAAAQQLAERRAGPGGSPAAHSATHDT